LALATLSPTVALETGLTIPPNRVEEWMWLEQICINQDDDEEKAQQISFMIDIYRSAKQILIYIGPWGGHHPRHPLAD
jgi:hypothetical protein